MMVSTVRRGPAIENLGDVFAWFRVRPWFYVYTVFVLWALVPELRRIIDWKTGFSAVSVISIVPLLSLLPSVAALCYPSRLRKLRRELIWAAWLWVGAFAYAYTIAIVSGNFPPATYTFIGFMLPMCFGLVVATFDVPMDVLYEHIAKFALALSVPISLYAFFQFAFPPGWDLFWIQSTGLVAVGVPQAFEFRPFATLNGPGPFADFLAAIVVLNLPRLRDANVWLLSAIAIDVAGIGVTFVRSDWIAFLLAVLVFVALSPRRVQNLSLVAVLAVVLGLFGAGAGSIFGPNVGYELQLRLQSLTTVTTDSSYLDRQVLFNNALATALAQPTGEGLGVTGTAAKLGAGGATADFDNGYLARFTEMGYAGMLGYLATIALMFGLSLRRWWVVSRARDLKAASIVAAAIAIQAAFAFLDISGDHHVQFAGIFCWLSFALVFGYRAKNEPAT